MYLRVSAAQRRQSQIRRRASGGLLVVLQNQTTRRKMFIRGEHADLQFHFILTEKKRLDISLEYEKDMLWIMISKG